MSVSFVFRPRNQAPDVPKETLVTHRFVHNLFRVLFSAENSYFLAEMLNTMLRNPASLSKIVFFQNYEYTIKKMSTQRLNTMNLLPICEITVRFDCSESEKKGVVGGKRELYAWLENESWRHEIFVLLCHLPPHPFHTLILISIGNGLSARAVR